MVKTVSPAVYWDFSAVRQIKSEKEAAKEFSVYLFEVFLKEAFDSEVKGLFNTSFPSKMYRDMFVMELSELLGRQDAGGLGSFSEKALHSYRTYGKG